MKFKTTIVMDIPDKYIDEEVNEINIKKSEYVKELKESISKTIKGILLDQNLEKIEIDKIKTTVSR